VFTLHLNGRLNAASKALNDIKHLNKLSLTTAIRLFQLKVNPVATYGLENIWVHLKKRQLERLEKLKATFLKRAVCLSKYTPSRLVYELTREVPCVEELRLESLLPATPAYVELLQELQVKKAKIWEEFYTTDSMINREWTQGGYELRHVMTRLSVHGFHHRLCQAKSFHEPGPECVCIRCGNNCEIPRIKL
jgi:hypothetical protein